MKGSLALAAGVIIGGAVMISAYGKKPEAGNAGKHALDPVAAALTIYSKEIIVGTAPGFCRMHVPNTATTVQAAADRWLEKHAVVRSRKNVVLHDRFTQHELLDIAEKSRAENEAILQAMDRAPLGEQTQWCERAPVAFDSAEFDLSGNRGIFDAVMGYRPIPQ